MALDFSDPAVKKAIDAIRDPSNEDEWVIIGHVGTTNKLRVVETGSGFDDFMDEIDASKILYGYMRFDVNSMNKYLFVSFCGDGIQDQMFKGKFGAFQREMERFMKGYYHVHINARQEDDLDEDEIYDKLRVATGALYALQTNKRTLTTDEAKRNLTERKPAVVPRTQVTIDQSESAKFWEREQKEQEAREQERQQQQRKVDHAAEVAKQRSAFWKQQQQQKEEEQQERKEREAELASIQSKSKNFWKQQQQQEEAEPEEQQPVIKKVTPSSESTSSLRARFEQLAMEKKEEAAAVSRPAPRPVRKFPPVKSADSGEEGAPETVTRPQPPVFSKPQQEPEPEPEPEQYEEPEPEPEQYEEPEPEPEQYEEPEHEQYEEPEQQYEEPEQQYEEPEQQYEEPEQHYEDPEQHYAEEQEQYYGEQEQHYEVQERTIVALFDFQSDDPEELPFVEGEHLVLVRDDGDWWLAQNAEGRQGFVPANYFQE